MQKILIRTVQSLIRKTPRCGYSGITAAVAQKHNAPVWQKLSFIPQFNFASYDQIMAGKLQHGNLRFSPLSGIAFCGPAYELAPNTKSHLREYE